MNDYRIQKVKKQNYEFQLLLNKRFLKYLIVDYRN